MGRQCYNGSKLFHAAKVVNMVILSRQGYNTKLLLLIVVTNDSRECYPRWVQTILELSVAHGIYYCDYIVCRLLEWYLLGSVLNAAATSFVDAQILVSDIRTLSLCHLAVRWTTSIDILLVNELHC